MQLLVRMAQEDTSLWHSAKSLSVHSGLPLPTVSKLLKLLVQQGILESCQGSRGGYSLAKSVNEITVAEIVQSFEGPLAPADCRSGKGSPQDGLVGPVCRKLNNVIACFLHDLTLTDMANGIFETAGKSIRITNAKEKRSHHD